MVSLVPRQLSCACAHGLGDVLSSGGARIRRGRFAHSNLPHASAGYNSACEWKVRMSQEAVREREGEEHVQLNYDVPLITHLVPSEAAANTQQVTSHQLIEQSLEEMIADMNAKRSRDQTLLQSECTIM